MLIAWFTTLGRVVIILRSYLVPCSTRNYGRNSALAGDSIAVCGSMAYAMSQAATDE